MRLCLFRVEAEPYVSPQALELFDGIIAETAAFGAERRGASGEPLRAKPMPDLAMKVGPRGGSGA
jgi:hypothetical protein